MTRKHIFKKKCIFVARTWRHSGAILVCCCVLYFLCAHFVSSWRHAGLSLGSVFWLRAFGAMLVGERAMLVGKRAIIRAMLAPCWLGQRANLVVCSSKRRAGPMLLGGAKSMGGERHAFQPQQA